MTRVIVVEDEQSFRQMLLSQLSRDPQIDVVGEAASGEEAIELADELDPEVMLMDIELAGGMTGIEAGHRIKAKRPSMGIVLLSNHRAKQFIVSMAGWSYLLKKNVRDLDAVARAIKGAAWGMIVVDPAITESLQPRSDSPLAQLEAEEVKVLELLAQGYSELAIAQEIGIRLSVVRSALSNVYFKLGILEDGRADPRVMAVRIYLEDTKGF
jgi:DNA-binding NarL/FixJ family response regulator